jgi:hypothetical protein
MDGLVCVFRFVIRIGVVTRLVLLLLVLLVVDMLLSLSLSILVERWQTRGVSGKEIFDNSNSYDGKNY